MNDDLTYSAASLRCRDAIPSTRIACSRDAGWRSVFVSHHRDLPSEEVFETLPTPDKTIVVMTRGEQEVACFKGGLWRRAVYQAGTVGLTPPATSTGCAGTLAARQPPSRR